MRIDNHKLGSPSAMSTEFAALSVKPQGSSGFKEIGRAAEDVAIRYASDEEDGNLQRAASRLGVTDRALQLRRANRRQMSDVK
jgi:DNA-binding NtrC family response regulator